ncbi:hypothetical protein [Piscirickettsia salmonis]|nr:hypothetical protein [Piscirickettsia salmonis]ERL62876.1 hypothetical protein K661_00774 [Piscirickettsia salmonis LF-89 = ATCC VR-1361]QHS33475.1 hypothetical protein GW535_14190 [Piscirickettsia salmonis]QIX54553.1 hypothetical protein GW536_02600 [Piscirickettsia salmonis]QNR80961.1 hypothetical protein ICC15_02810 [Piscirickettsia salmonis]WGZ71992.1 hypothetical protein E3220_10495 [Piscirickettsia salmonis EM-90]
MKITAEGQRQMAKAGFASEESARQAAGRVGFIGEGKVIGQPVSLQSLKTRSSLSSSSVKTAAVGTGAKKDDEWHFFEDGEGKWRWLRISSTGKRYVSPVGFVSVKLARAMQKTLAMVAFALTVHKCTAFRIKA